MHITKSQMLLSLTENLLDQEDQAILENIYRQTGLILEELLDSELEILMNEVTKYEMNAPRISPDAIMASKTMRNSALGDAHPQSFISHAADTVGHHVTNTYNAVKQTPVAQGAIHHASNAMQHVSSFAQTPHGAALMAGGALALGAAAALRRRSRNKAAAQG